MSPVLDEILKVKITRNEEGFRKEYRDFLEKFLYPLLGKVDVEIDEMVNESCKINTIIEEEAGKVYFCAGGKRYFKTEATLHLGYDDDNMCISRNIVQAFLNYSSYAYSKSYRQKNYYSSDVSREKVWQMVIQEGIARWSFGVTSDKITTKFFDILEKWAVKTYEGKHVTLGFVVNPSSQKGQMLSFEELQAFLEDDSSAVLSDCIHSVMEVDKHCNLIDYLSVTKDVTKIAACELNSYVPLRFLHTVQQFVPENSGKAGSDKVGIFLLNNGDILIVKNGAIKFVKRNLRWLSMNNSAFIASLGFDVQGSSESLRKLLASIYASVLDVSFSHSGGLIAIIAPDKVQELMSLKVLNPYNNLIMSVEAAVELSKRLGYLKQNEMPSAEQVIRRKLLTQLLKGTSFSDTDRKLRSEIIALDGACIVGEDGTIYSCGAIIQNDSGSSTGGRSSAAKKLSQYGVAIKISTDGYIEVYRENKLVYAIK